MRKYLSILGLFVLAGCGGGGGGGSDSCSLTDLTCPLGQVCQFDQGSCGDVGAPGTCVVPGVSCDAVTTVCTCAGFTFNNECNAQNGGHSVRAAGDCA